MNEIVRQIRIDLRHSMNGVASKSMREKGLDYKFNWGVDIVRLREIASRYEADAELAESLWHEQTRELKILATLLYPLDAFDMEKAERWVREITVHEIREQACFNLFGRLSFADRLVENWTDSAEDEIRTTGYGLLCRLALERRKILEKAAFRRPLIDRASTDLHSEGYFLRFSAHNALKFLGRMSTASARDILDKISAFEHSSDPEKREIFNSLNFEFGCS